MTDLPRRTPDGTPASRPPAARFNVSLPVTNLAVDPGNEVGCVARIRNVGTIVDRYSAEVEGDAAVWSEVDPPSVSLMPDTEGICRIWFRPPRAPTVTAGEVSFDVLVRSTSDASFVRSAEGVVEVRPFADTRVRLQPQESRGGLAGEHRLLVENQGNAPVALTVEARDPRDALVMAVEPIALSVAPGTTAVARVTVQARDAARGPHPHQHSFKLLARSAQGSAFTVHGMFVQEAQPQEAQPQEAQRPPSDGQAAPPEAPQAPSATEAAARPRRGYAATLLGSVLGTLALGVPLGLLGVLIGFLAAGDDELGRLLLVLLVGTAFAAFGGWVGATLGAWRALRTRGYPGAVATAGALAVLLPAWFALMAAAIETLGVLVVPLIPLVPPLVARRLAVMLKRA